LSGRRIQNARDCEGFGREPAAGNIPERRRVGVAGLREPTREWRRDAHVVHGIGVERRRTDIVHHDRHAAKSPRSLLEDVCPHVPRGAGPVEIIILAPGVDLLSRVESCDGVRAEGQTEGPPLPVLQVQPVKGGGAEGVAVGARVALLAADVHDKGATEIRVRLVVADVLRYVDVDVDHPVLGAKGAKRKGKLPPGVQDLRVVGQLEVSVPFEELLRHGHIEGVEALLDRVGSARDEVIAVVEDLAVLQSGCGNAGKILVGGL